MSVQFETQEHVAIITLDRPEARNAINGVMSTGIEAALDRYENDDSLWGAILTANGPVFCAGADLKEIAAGNAGAMATAKGGFGGLVQRARTKPLIAALQGPALAGGCEIALACDMIVASNEAFFALPEVKRALIAVAGGLFRLPRAIGMAQAMEVILTGEPLSVERAHQLGLVNRLANPAEVRDEALAIAQKIASNAPLAVQASRNLAARAFTTDEATLWREGFEAFQKNMQSEDAKEGPRAFIEKRAPRWKAR
jgi:enoyl-CoA hydratase